METGVGSVKNIAVIGAGMAGLSCSQALQQAGYLVTVFEKSVGLRGGCLCARVKAGNVTMARSILR